jgi:alkaline phosphatase D
MTTFLRLLICLLFLGPPGALANDYRITFGSCYEQDNQNLPIWKAINNQQPDLFLFLGDNVYVDSTDPAKFRKDYELLFTNPGVVELMQNVSIMATWDDHDYGLNDGGKDFQAKQVAKAAFVNAFNYPELQNIPKEQGIYHSRVIEVDGKIIRILMLDTRWYRDSLLEHQLSKQTRERFELGPYRPHLDESKTLLGEKQWQWLEQTLLEPVDLNIVVSSIQVLAEFTAWETWANFPHERKRLLDMIQATSAGKTILLSGDVHRGEISVLPMADWELFEITSSGLSANIYPGKPNIYRLGPAYPVHNFGSLELVVKDNVITVNAGLYDQSGVLLGNQTITINN